MALAVFAIVATGASLSVSVVVTAATTGTSVAVAALATLILASSISPWQYHREKNPSHPQQPVLSKAQSGHYSQGTFGKSAKCIHF